MKTLDQLLDEQTVWEPQSAAWQAARLVAQAWSEQEGAARVLEIEKAKGLLRALGAGCEPFKDDTLDALIRNHDLEMDGDGMRELRERCDKAEAERDELRRESAHNLAELARPAFDRAEKAESELSALWERVKLVPHLCGEAQDDLGGELETETCILLYQGHSETDCAERGGQCAFAAAAQAVEPQKGE